MMMKSDANDPDLYAAYLNFYFRKSRKSGIRLSDKPGEGEHLKLSEQGENSGSAFLVSDVIYMNEDFEAGIKWINKGIDIAPNRLDLRLGKAYSYGQAERWEELGKTIDQTLEYAYNNKHQWSWMSENDKLSNNPEEFLLDAIQDYNLMVYDTEDDGLLPYMRAYSQSILTHKPDHVPSLSNVAVTFLLEENYAEALVVLLQAEAYAPSDYVVLANIAETYDRSGDTEKALEYYKKLSVHGDPRTKEYANQKISVLSK